ncbi:MAG: DUF5671 domain-containing protein [Patescibacteria group bacterium]
MNSISPHSYARDFFLHLITVVLLYASVVSAITLLFQYINVLFPDQLSFYYAGALGAIRWSTATLLIMYPVFVLTSWILQREMKASPEKAEFRIRRWLLALTLFLASLTIIIDLITLVYNFLSGELSVRFMLKVLVIFAVTGTVFGYYMWEWRRKHFGKSPIQRSFAWGVSVFVIAAIAASFFIVGSPNYQRKVRLDEQRVQHLQNIQYEIINYWQQKKSLPSSIASLTDPIRGFTVPIDPVSGEPYGYTAVSALSFELCATFDVATPEPLRTPTGRSEVVGPYGETNQSWVHEAGVDCFDRTIDPELYRLKEGMIVPRPVY